MNFNTFLKRLTVVVLIYVSVQTYIKIVDLEVVDVFVLHQPLRPTPSPTPLPVFVVFDDLEGSPADESSKQEESTLGHAFVEQAPADLEKELEKEVDDDEEPVIPFQVPLPVASPKKPASKGVMLQKTSKSMVRAVRIDEEEKEEMMNDPKWRSQFVQLRYLDSIPLDDLVLEDEERLIAERGERLKQAALQKLKGPFNFVHLPKTAGTALSFSIAYLYQICQFWAAFPIEQMAPCLSSPQTTTIFGHLSWGIHKLWGLAFADDRYNGSNNITRFTPEEKELYFAKKEAIEKWKTGETDPVYLTMMREPVARTASNYLYHHGKSNEYNHFETLNCSMTCYLNKTDNGNNIMTAMLSGAGPGTYWNDDDHAINVLPNIVKYRSEVADKYIVKHEHYLLARRHLINMIVGLQERYIDSLEHFRFFTELPVPMKENLFVNSISALKTTYKLTPEDLFAAEAINFWDIKLYELGERLFEQQHQIYLTTSRLRS